MGGIVYDMGRAGRGRASVSLAVNHAENIRYVCSAK